MMVLVIAMIAAGEHVNEEMITRTLELLLVYSSKSVTEGVLLAIALLNASKPSVTIVDQVMRKTAGGGETNVCELCWLITCRIQTLPPTEYSVCDHYLHLELCECCIGSRNRGLWIL